MDELHQPVRSSVRQPTSDVVVVSLLVGLSVLIGGASAVYYTTNRRLRPVSLRPDASASQLDMLVGTGLLAFVVPAGVALLLGPILYALLSRATTASATEDVAFFTLSLAGGFLALAGSGMHAAGRSIDTHVAALGSAPDTLRRTAALYHGPLGHYPVHIGWSLGLVGVAGLAVAHPLNVSDQASTLLVLAVAGLVHGLVRTASILDARTWRVLLPLDVTASVLVSLRLVYLSANPMALYFLVALAITPIVLTVWGLTHRGFPSTAPGWQRGLG
jgi:hypothetical protein